jgi:hypothetical protein
MTLYDQAQAIANSSGAPCWIVHPPHRPAYIARHMHQVEPCHQMLQRILPEHGYLSIWKPQ